MEGSTHKHRLNFLASIFPTTLHRYDGDDHDVIDVPAKTPFISTFDIFLLACSIIMHIVDLGFDYNIAIRYFLGGKLIYFTWTICFIVIPSLINVIISRRMQYQDNEMTSNTETLHERTNMSRVIDKLYFITAVLLQLAPVVRYWRTLVYALKARECQKREDRVGTKRYYLMMLKEDQDVALLRVFECFLEAAPQQILQLTLMLKHYHHEINLEFIHQVGSILSSLGSMGWAMASYHRSIRLVQQNKLNIGIVGTILQFLWHFCITVARILSLSVIASIWPMYTIICCVTHWVGMTIWILIDSHGMLLFCRNYSHSPPPHTLPTFQERIYSVLFAAVIGIVHIFIYLNVVDGNTFWKHVCFYVLCFFENVASNVVWRYTSSVKVKSAWYFDTFLALCIFSFFLGIIAMIVYYTTFHPTKNKQRRASLKESVQATI